MLITSPTIKSTKKKNGTSCLLTDPGASSAESSYISSPSCANWRVYNTPIPSHLLSNKTGPVLKRSSLQLVKHGSQPVQTNLNWYWLSFPLLERSQFSFMQMISHLKLLRTCSHNKREIVLLFCSEDHASIDKKQRPKSPWV